jgi:hypothetical protein
MRMALYLHLGPFSKHVINEICRAGRYASYERHLACAVNSSRCGLMDGKIRDASDSCLGITKEESGTASVNYGIC